MYSIAVRIEDIEKRRMTAGGFHVIIGLFILIKGSDYLKLQGYNNFLSVAPFYLIALLSILFGFFFRRRMYTLAKLNNRVRLLQVFSFLALSFVFGRLNQNFDLIFSLVFGLLSIILYVSERRIFEETCLKINEEGLSIPGSYGEHMVPWSELSEVIIREDFITIFHVKKKYLQYQVIQDLSTLEVAKMNAFCKEFAKGTMEEN